MPQYGVIGAPPSQGGGGGMQMPTQMSQGYQYPNGQIVYTQPQQTSYMGQQSQNQVQFPPQSQQTTKPTAIPVNGRFVESLNEVAPNEVSMDGSVSLFPLRDCSRIYARAWTSNGTIQTVEYIPVINNGDGQSSAQNDISAEILSRLEAIEKKLDKKPYYGKKPYNKQREKKEDNNA